MNSLKTFMNKVGESLREVTPQGSTTIIDGTSPNDTEMEGFVCPTCFLHFSSPELLEQHYSEKHLYPSANYLCPVCRARLNTQTELEVHYSSNHGDRDFNNHSLEALREELMELSTNLREERWYSEELKKEVERLQDAFKKKGTEESDTDVYVHKSQLDVLEESKAFLSSEVVLLRKQLTEALQKCSSLRTEKDSLEQRASDFAVERAELRATFDSLQEEKVGLESQLHDATCNISTLEINKKEEKEKQNSEVTKLQELLNFKTKECHNQKELEKTLQQDLKLKSEASAELKDELRNLKMDFDLMKKQLQEKYDETNSLNVKLKEQELKLSAVTLAKSQEIQEETVQEKENLIITVPDESKCENDVLQKHMGEVDLLRSQLHETEKSKSRAEELAMEKLKEIDDLEDVISNLNSSTNEKNDIISKLEGAAKDKEQTIDLLSGKVEEIFSLRKEIEQERELTANTRKEINFKNVTISNLEKDIENYISQIEEISNNKIRLETELQDTHEALKQKKMENESNIAEWISCKEDLKESELTAISLNEKINTLNAKEKNMNLMLKTNMDEIQDLKSLVELLRSEKLNFEKELEIVQNKCSSSDKVAKNHAEHQINLQNKIVQLEKHVQDTEGKAHSISTELSTQITALEHRENTLREENNSFKTKMKEFEEEKMVLFAKEKQRINIISTIKQNLQAKEESEMQLSKSLSTLERDKSEIEEKNLLAVKEIEILHTKLRKQEADAITYKKRISELDDRIAAQEAEMAGLSGDKLELEVKVEAASEEQKSLVERCVAAEAEIERLQQQLTQLRRKLDDSTAALHELGRENQSLQMETAKLSERKWAEDSEVVHCSQCRKNFSMTVRRHHCRNCLQIFCNDCSSKQAAVEQNRNAVRVCDGCYAEITSRI